MKIVGSDHDHHRLAENAVSATWDERLSARSCDRTTICEADFMHNQLFEEDCALALISGIEGPAYRPLGAAMAITTDRKKAGNLSSGCIEEDITRHALDALRTGKPRKLVYGAGSSYGDLHLPCGGRLEILVLPRPDRKHLAALSEKLRRREDATLYINRSRQSLVIDAAQADLAITIRPDIRFCVFGKGAEAAFFAAMAHRSGYPTRFFSPDRRDLAESDVAFTHMTSARWPETLFIDRHTAITFFFHDHDYALPLLAGALQSQAFYIGSQGSRKAAGKQKGDLRARDLPSYLVERLIMPIGLIPSVRDPRALAISVLADVIQHARNRL